MNFLQYLGKRFLKVVEDAGGIFLFFLKSLVYFFIPPFRFRLLIKHMEFIGVKSFWVVFLTALFSGMVTAYQVNIALAKVGSQSILGGAVALTLTRELGPVLTAIVVVARAGSAICAELGSMRITEQIDALKIMAVNPIQYLLSPRLWASILVLPLLTAIADLIGILGGYVVGVFLVKIDPGLLTARMVDMVEFKDIMSGIIKSIFFGAFLVSVCGYKGYNVRGGAEGVGRATTEAVVVSTVGILVMDYILTTLFF
ncbi:ABC transporter permease [Thermodesulfobacterium sp. TA1]|uniref:MlaE family ABC transporter permease n=1 Tax=Thermodesulfobacterium sp. TA1 TaxID=2234087 RepID=UPI001231E019|nr:ABC transporter permease [Thermodesulfobacterium sp. TA1]QER41541.1 ABC transporter permease [Thermodesulfobacterium sp. TA1]